MNERRVGIAAALDTASVVVFAAVGVRSHEIDSGFGDVFTIAAPFLIGLAIGWLVARAWDRPFAIVTGLIAWAATIAIGMPLRNVVFDRGTAASFVVVATLFTAACLIGWRLVARFVTRRTFGSRRTSAGVR